jgi:rhamnulokinase
VAERGGALSAEAVAVAEPLRLAAVDLGAETGRVVLGRFDGETVSLDVRHRFANRPLWLPDGLHWNLPGLFAETLQGLGAAADGGALDGIGIDAWGCDYALLDGGRRMLGLPFSYRDERTSVRNMERAHAVVDRAELYGRTGIQTMPINTVYQLAAEAGAAAAQAAEHIALVPDLIGLWLTGTLANELTIASTTGLLEAHGRRWASDLVDRLELPRAAFNGEAVAPGFELGPVLDRHAGEAGAAAGAPVRAVGGHDTASAFAAAPLSGPHDAVLSSGTWSLLGVELPEPELGPDAAAFNLTNERGVCGTVRLLRNVMGLWLVQECRRVWRAGGSEHDYGELQALAAQARTDVPVFDPDDDSLLHGGDMPARITGLCTGAGEAGPAGEGELVRSILVSLACKYRLVTEQLERVSGRRIDTIHVVGGGARNELLCRLTADVCGREVITGPVEATALGNVLVQALALGELAGLGDLRRVVERSVAARHHEPHGSSAGAETYARFLETTGLRAPSAARTPVS